MGTRNGEQLTASRPALWENSPERGSLPLSPLLPRVGSGRASQELKRGDRVRLTVRPGAGLIYPREEGSA